MILRHHSVLQTATGWFLVLAFVFTCGVPVPARGNFQKPASVFQKQKATGAAGPTSVAGYTHDAVGNRLTRSSSVAGLPAGTYAFDANDRLLSDIYDANGNTIASENKSDSYDFEDRLVARTETGKNIAVVYDGDGNRVRETVTVGTTVTGCDRSVM